MVPVSMGTLLSWLKKYREDLSKLGQGVKDNCLNYLSCLYLCKKQVIDVNEIYPDATKQELDEAYIIINSKLS